jgi:Peptidase family M48/PDZ domain
MISPVMALALLALPLSASASDRSGAAPGSFLRPGDHRIASITFRLAKAGAALCPTPYPLTGLTFHHLPEYELRDRPQIIAAYRLDRGPGVLSVVADSPAAEATLTAGDVLLAIDGEPFPSPPMETKDRKVWRKQLEEAERLLEERLRTGPARLRVLRGGRELEITLGSISGCPGRVRLANSRQTNAFATGRQVVMTTALLDFIRGDDELAIVIAHELAHNILDHPDRLKAQNVPHGILRGFGKNAARVRTTEEEADRLAIRLAWAAGYDVSAAIPFWRRYYAKYGRAPQLFRTHPGLAARERLIAQAIAELPSNSAAPPPPIPTH